VSPPPDGRTAPLAIHVAARQAHKGGERGADCQDAWWAGLDPPRVAVADGATRAFFAREWAWLVARRFCDDGALADALLAAPASPWREALGPAREAWRAAVWAVIQRAPARGLLENRFHRRDAGITTLVGVEVDAARGRWRAVLIGDSCLMRFGRDGGFRDSVPVRDPDAFDSHPEALISVAGSARETEPRAVDGLASPDEVLVLATDAAARWLLSFRETDRFAAAMGLLGEDDDGFGGRVAVARRSDQPGAPAMEDDDVTLVVVAFGEPLPGTRPLEHVVAAELPPPFAPTASDGDAPSGDEASSDARAAVVIPRELRPEPDGAGTSPTDASGPAAWMATSDVHHPRNEAEEDDRLDDAREAPVDAGESTPRRRAERMLDGVHHRLGPRRVTALMLAGWGVILLIGLSSLLLQRGSEPRDSKSPDPVTPAGPLGAAAAPAEVRGFTSILSPFGIDTHPAEGQPWNAPDR
jgi:Protein phosphatase 2C